MSTTRVLTRDVAAAEPPHRNERPKRRLRIRDVSVVLASIAVVALFAVLLLVAGGVDVGSALSTLVTGSLGNRFNLGETLIRAAPILLIAVGLVPSLRVGLFNIGAPGQMGIGALLSTVVLLHTSSWSGWAALFVGIGASAVGGAMCALIPALMRAIGNINEVISTLVINFLVLNLLTYLLNGPLKAAGAATPTTDTLAAHQWIPNILSGSRAHAGVIIALVACLLLALWVHTPGGYRLKLLGASRPLAAQAKIIERRVILRVMLLSGAAAGVAGWFQVAGIDHALMPTVADPVGYTGLFAALLGGLTALGTLLSSFFLGALLQGGNSLQIGAGVSPELAQALLGIILLAVSLLQADAARRRTGGR